MADFIRINEKDNVVTVVRAISTGEIIDVAGDHISVLDNIPVYHKMAAAAIAAGASVYKYGESIGTAVRDIKPGEWVHVHNIDSNRGRGDKA